MYPTPKVKWRQRRIPARTLCFEFDVDQKVKIEGIKENGHSSPDMSSLSIFPSEILEYITSVVSTPQQTRLWQCGDRILNYKLKNGGLKRTSLCWPGLSLMPWPRWYFTTFNGLVDVEWGMDFGTSMCPTLELNLLPKTLKRLHLACDDVFIILRQQYINMQEMLPLVESLHLTGLRLREENLKNLPANLIELCVTCHFTEIKSARIFGDLPRLIERLTLAFYIVDQSELENDLPNQLICLNIFRIECNFNWVSKLPKSLKTLKICHRGFTPDWRTLPCQLEELVVKPRIRRMLGGLLPKSCLPQLPQSLKSLKLAWIEDLNAGDEVGPLLPKNLTKLKLSAHKPIDHVGLQQLPISLTDFDAYLSATHPDMLSLYNPGTIKIRIVKGPFSDKLNLFSFPTKLSTLELPHISDDIVAMLPPGLQHLKIVQGGLMTIKGASKLPKSLTSFTAPIQIFNDKQTMSYLGRISKLELLCVTKLARNLHDWISSLLPFSSQVTNINGFNQQLTSLQVSSKGQIRPIKKLFFEALPHFVNLKTLKINSFLEISSDWLSLIPGNVTELQVRFLTSYPTATQLSSLPKGIRYLGIHVRDGGPKGCDWTDETLLSLPRSLQLLSMDHVPRKLTQRMYEYLPPNLQTATLVYGKSSFITPLNRLYGKDG